MSIFSRLAEQKIEEAIRNGELDHMPYAGKKLPIDDLSHIPEDLRMSYRIMKMRVMSLKKLRFARNAFSCMTCSPARR